MYMFRYDAKHKEKLPYFDAFPLCLPFEPTILSILTEANIAFNLIERQGGHASNMIQIVNLASLLNKITPELESRLRPTSVAD